MKVRIIGIAGGSGSGKSTFVNSLKNAFPEQIAVINCDNYYRRHDDLSLDERRLLNYDSPDSIEFSLMREQLDRLRHGHSIECPVYDFSIHNRLDVVSLVRPKPFIVIDGILLLSDPALRELMDLKIFVETDADERILRRTRRDVVERGRTLESVMEQYLKTVKPMHNLYVEPSKVYADLIVNGGMDPKAIEVVESWIRLKLQEDSKKGCPGPVQE